jgi:GxxExxY protein
MNQKQIVTAADKIKEIGNEVRRNLGCGFNETIYQNALAIEFRQAGIHYLKEVNIEIFYKEEGVGADRPDFIITKIGRQKISFILEIKISDKITDDHRTQLQSYCTSLPKNDNPVLRNFAGGLILSFPKCEIENNPEVKLFVVDNKFRVLLDEQKEEEIKIKEEKERIKKDKV